VTGGSSATIPVGLQPVAGSARNAPRCSPANVAGCLVHASGARSSRPSRCHAGLAGAPRNSLKKCCGAHDQLGQHALATPARTIAEPALCNRSRGSPGLTLRSAASYLSRAFDGPVRGRPGRARRSGMTWPSPGSPNVRPCCPDEKFRVSIGFPEVRETGTTLLQALDGPGKPAA